MGILYQHFPRLLFWQVVSLSVSFGLLASDLSVQYGVISNLDPTVNGFKANITLSYNGSTLYNATNWELYFTHIRLLQPETLKSNPDALVPLGDSGIGVGHIDGSLHVLKPLQGFRGFLPNSRLELPLVGSDWSVSKNDVFPSWYVVENGGTSVIATTAGEGLKFVDEFDTVEQWKRSEMDEYDPWQPEQRYSRNDDSSGGGQERLILPTPLSSTLNEAVRVNITVNWLVVYESEELLWEASYLAGKLGISYVNASTGISDSFILLSINQSNTNLESYHLLINSQPASVKITSASSTGVFYGVQSLLGLSSNPSRSVPPGSVQDSPRYRYRGMHLDVARNFKTTEDLLQLLELMSWYKLNKLHFHLTDDEGWRIEIQNLTELTEVGGFRCHDPSEMQCLVPQYGSNPARSISSTFFSRDQYQEILKFANDRHIEVIPEIDMPGHSNAAIKAMEARYENLKDSNPEGAMEFLLTTVNESTTYMSVQNFRKNTINPCLNSSYDFVLQVIRSLKDLHKDIQPLRTFHLGGDEVPAGAFDDMDACKTLAANNPNFDLTTHGLQEYFILNVAELAYIEGLNISAWEDGVMKTGSEPYNRSIFLNPEVEAYAWSNVWEWGHGSRAYNLANKGYKVVISHATHLYFDHPQEPNPQERGLYWATRFTDTRKAFWFNAANVYENINETVMGQPLTKADVCKNPDTDCPPLQAVDNVIGIQGQLWAETVRTSQLAQEMIFPRLMALAERAWHQATWETMEPGPGRDTEMRSDWQGFVQQLATRELSRLDAYNVSYYLPPPGARITNGNLEMNCQLDGLPLFYSFDSSLTWTQYRGIVAVGNQTAIHLHSRSMNNQRHSRTVVLNQINTVVPNDSDSSHGCKIRSSAIILGIVAFMLTPALGFISEC